MNIPFTISGLRKIGLTQAQIGSKIGLKQSSVSDMEAGKAGIKNPSARVVEGLVALAKKHRVATEPAPLVPSEIHSAELATPASPTPASAAVRERKPETNA